MSEIKPDYERKNIKLYRGDCLEVMPRLIEAGVVVDAIIADLPYKKTALHWDSLIPFGPLWVNYKQLITKRGAVALFGAQPFTSQVVMSNLEWFRHDIIWEKDNGAAFILGAHRPNQVHESILIFSQGHYHPNAENKATYNPIVTSGRKPTLAEITVFGDKSQRLNDISWRPNPTKQIAYDKNGAHLRSVLYFRRDRPVLHHTQKPVRLLETLVKLYTNPDDLILDNTCGSGTAAIPCIWHNRQFIGIEKDKAIFETAVKRIDAELDKPTFFELLEEVKPTMEQIELF